MDLVENIAAHIVNTTYEDLPQETVIQTKREILDVLGCTVAGLYDGDVQLIKRALGKFNHYAPYEHSLQSVLWMVAAARSNDYDPINDETGDHPSIATVLSSLILPRVSGVTVSGRDMITALALGVDVVLRIRKGTPQRLGEHPWIAGTFAPFAAVTATAKLLGLDENQTRNALGLAFTVCSNTAQGLREGTNSYKAHHGWAIRAGIEAAFLAAEGMKGVQAMLEGEYGLYAVYHAQNYDRNLVLDGLGSYFHNRHVGFKIYPCCRLMHGAIDAARKVRQAHGVGAEDIASATVAVNRSAYVLCSKMPWYKPRLTDDLRFSIPYGVALGFLADQVGMEHFSPQAVDNPQADAIAGKTTVVIDEELNKIKSQLAPTIITVRLKSGQVIQERVEMPKGHPNNPLSAEELEHKFRDNIAWSGLADRSWADQMIDAVMQVEQMADIADLCPLLWQ